MKNYKVLLIACIATLGFTSCVQDLNTQPIDPNVYQKFDQDRIYYKIYAGLGTSGQIGPNGNCDIVANDEGYSVFYRLMFVHNEFPTDEGWWIWNDAGVTDLNEMTWNATNDFTKLLYNRLTFNVTTCNHFLDNTANLGDEKTLRQRAEVTFMRCLNYYYLLDFFGIPPFTMTVSSANPRQFIDLSNDKTNAAKKIQCRAALFRWVLDELLAAENYLEEETEVYRVNRNAARLLLARLYLNAHVYDPEHQYVTEANALDSAALYAKKVMDNGKYKLTDHYAEMFMGDNDHNNGACEVIFAIPQDGDYIQSWGASSCLVCMTRAQGMMDWGSDDKWECFRSSPELVNTFLKPTGKTAGSIAADEFAMPGLLADDRAMLCNEAKAVATAPDSVTWKATNTGGAAYGTGNFNKGWAICKWTGCYSTGEPRGKHKNFVDTDVPLFRVAEAYMTYAEALYRQGKVDDAMNVITDLRAKRHADPLTGTLTDEILLDEWLREFFCEGRRRIDLIRFGQFCGENSTKEWEGHTKGKSGKYIVYPIPSTDLVANPNLAQNEGY